QYKDDLIDFDIWPAGLPDLSSNVLGIINDDENLAMKQELESALIRLKVAEEENALLKKKLENIKDIVNLCVLIVLKNNVQRFLYDEQTFS
ncbi:unnamed protein product, partial [Didymodactylos carnosus]